MGGAGGVIIVTEVRIVINKSLPDEDQIKLNTIASRSITKCSFLDSIKAAFIIARALRS